MVDSLHLVRSQNSQSTAADFKRSMKRAVRKTISVLTFSSPRIVWPMEKIYGLQMKKKGGVHWSCVMSRETTMLLSTTVSIDRIPASQAARVANFLDEEIQWPLTEDGLPEQAAQKLCLCILASANPLQTLRPNPNDKEVPSKTIGFFDIT